MKSLHRMLLLVGIVAIMLFAAACGDKQNAAKPGNGDTASIDNNSDNEAQQEQQSNVQDNESEEENGNNASVERDPRVDELLAQFESLENPKVIPISVAMAELLDELDVMPIGVPMSSMALPEAFADLPRIGSTIQPDLEQLVKLQPDVVLIPESLKDSLGKKLETTSLKLAFLPVDSLDEMKLSVQVFGALFDKVHEADDFLASFAEQEQQLIATYKEHEAPKVMFLFGSAESLMFMNENTFAGSLAHNLGAVNVVSEVLEVKETYAPLNMESIVEVNPDVILLIAHGDPDAVAKTFEADVKKNGAWEKLNAFQNDRMQTLPYELFGSASLTKAIAAYQEMADALYD